MENLKRIRRLKKLTLSNYQLVLLDNLIYLGKFEKLANNVTEEVSVGEIVADLLNGEIHQYWKDELKKDQSEDNPGQCMMKEDEWIEVLRAIENDPVLCSLVISDVVDADTDPTRENTNSRAARFTLMDGEQNPEETVIVFRGTHGAYTWNDNGEGATIPDSNSQKEALDYVNRIGAKLTTNGTITVTGHSKGGNLAQYIAICANNLTVDRCVSFDGQGFSDEFFETYKVAILANQDKLYSVNSSRDFVNPLMNTLVPEEHRMYLESNPVESLGGYHKPNNVFTFGSNSDNEKMATGLNNIAEQGILADFINRFIFFILQYEKDDSVSQADKVDTINTLLGFLEAGADPNDDIKSYQEVLIMDVITRSIDKYIGYMMLSNIASAPIYLLGGIAYSRSDFGTNAIYQHFVQDDAKIDRLEKAVRCLGEYTYAFFQQKDMEKGWLAALTIELMDKMPKGRLETLFVGLSEANDNINEEIGYYNYYPLEVFYKNELQQYADYSKTLNSRYGKKNTLGENYLGAEAASIIVANGLELNVDNMTKGSSSGDHCDNIVIGNGNDNTLYGDGGDDNVFGRNGNDILYGDDGRDILYGGKGDDILVGGAGADVYVIESADGIETIWKNHIGETPTDTLKNYDSISFGINLQRDCLK